MADLIQKTAALYSGAVSVIPGVSSVGIVQLFPAAAAIALSNF